MFWRVMLGQISGRCALDGGGGGGGGPGGVSLGDEKFWFNGLQYPGLKIAANNVGGVKFWFNGTVAHTLFR